jgi:hypothetical protein
MMRWKKISSGNYDAIAGPVPTVIASAHLSIQHQPPSPHSNTMAIDLKKYAEYFGFDGFRGAVHGGSHIGQRCGHILSTGSGKSLCYTARPDDQKITVVMMSPLISLVRDQFFHLSTTLWAAVGDGSRWVLPGPGPGDLHGRLGPSGATLLVCLTPESF